MNLRMKAFIAPLVFCFTLVLAQKGTSSLLHAESSLKLFDTHVHNSDIKRFGKEFYTYPDSFPDLNSSFSMTDFAESIGAPNSLNPLPNVTVSVSRVILMELEKQNNSFVAGALEAEFFQETADLCNADPITNCGGAVVAGIVASAPLEKGGDAVQEYVKHLKGGLAPLLVGIRQGLWTDDEMYLFSDPSFIQGVQALGEAGLVFDLLIHKESLHPEATSLVDAAPNTTFNLNHLGYPDIRNASALAQWQADLSELARRPNVYCKMSGLPQSYGAPGWSADDFVPYVAAALAAFGAARVNFAGNWFVLEDEEWEGTYPTMLAAVFGALAKAGVEAGSEDMEMILEKTAARLYGA